MATREGSLQELNQMHCPITAIVTAYRRIPETLATLAKLQTCIPAPAETLVHVDAGGEACREAVEQNFPEVRILTSDAPVGPGGARNKLIAAAKNELVASFDDDSYPLDLDYFDRLTETFRRFPDADIVSAAIFNRNESIENDNGPEEWVATFVGCGCAYRRSSFLGAEGYVPLPVAYGMEESDLALRLHARGGRILHSPWLRVYHDTDLSHHQNARITSGGVRNAALLIFLRYPASQWVTGGMQFLNVLRSYLKLGRVSGLGVGILAIPRYLYLHRSFRSVVSGQKIRSFRRLVRNPVPARANGGILPSRPINRLLKNDFSEK